MHRFIIAAAVSVCLSVLSVPALQAANLISDPFTDGSRTNASGGDTTGAVWYQTVNDSGQVTIVDDSAGIGSGKAMQLAPSGDFHKLLCFFPSTTLASAGDTLLVTFDYRFPTAPGSQGDGFRIGLGNSAGTKQTGDNGSASTRTDDKNYGFNTNPGLAGTSTGVRYENAGDDILGGADQSGTNTGARYSFGASGGSIASGTTKHSATLQITRFGNGDLYVQAQIDSLTPAIGTYASPALTSTFDEFAFGFGGTGYRPTILVDNVVIQSTSTNVLNITATNPTATTLAPATFTVTRIKSTGALSEPYTLSGTAANSVDYQTLSGTVSFADGQSSATITVTPIAEAFIETSKTVIVTLTQPTGTLLQTSSATATIADTTQAWSGQIMPQYSELYTFYVTANFGARLWIDDRLVAARSFPQAGEIRGQMRLTAGQRVNMRVESLEAFPGSGVTLEWSSPSQARQVVPSAQLSQPWVAKAGGSILKEHWTGIPGAAISALTSSANYPTKPNGRELITSFECLAQNWADSYGTRATGYIVPPATGSYTFAVSGDDTCQLSLSTDASSANKALIASVTSATNFRQWNAQPSQQSSAIALVQGQRYYVELLHKEDSGSDHWSVGWMKPGDSSFSVIPGSALVQAGLDTVQPAQANLLDTLAQSHPRLHATPERFAWLKAVWQSPASSQPKTWAASAISSANSILSQPPVVYSFSTTNQILDQARTVKDRMYYLGCAWWLTGDNTYAERAWTELNTVADNTLFPNWNDANSFLDTSEMTHACAIGYDWFYNYWTQARRDTIRTAIINKGLNAGLAQYTANVGWAKSTGNNWNMVCNGGMALGALAIADESVSLAEDILNRAINSQRPVVSHFTTDDGAWYEGPGYWTYETEYGTRMRAGLEWALGSDFGLSATPMFSETCFYALAMNGPGGVAFNYSDSGSGRVNEDALQWHARRFRQPLYAWHENTYGSGVLDALWWNDAPISPTAAGLAPDFAFHGQSGTSYKPTEAVAMRGNWSDSRAIFLGCKGGWVGADHGNFDAGDFVLDALGHRWFQDLGGDDYALAGYFSSTPNANGTDRWDYYRTRGEGQNTIIVDPGSGPDMIYNTVAPMLAYQSSATGRRSMAIFSLTPSTSGVTRMWRGFQLMGNRNQVLVQDEIVSTSAHTVWWFAHFAVPTVSVAIEPDGTAATLTQGSERLWVKIVSGGGTFQIMNATPLPTSPNPTGQNANTGSQKLAINLTSVANTTLAVWMVPLASGDNPPTTLPTITPLSTWNIAAANDAPVTPNATVTTIADQFVDVDLRNYATDDATNPGAMTFSVGNAANGTVALLGDGHTARFTPTAGYIGIPTFDYTATDGGGLSATGTFTVSAATGTQVWTATNSGAWSSGANWSTALAPVSSRGNTIEFFTGGTLGANATATNDTGAFAMNVLTLNGTASAAAGATIAGSALTLTNNGATNPVVNLTATTGSGLSFDVNTPLALAVATTFQGSGSAIFRFNGNISGAGALTKSGTSTLILTGTNSYAGGTTISAGTLQIGNNTANGTLPAGAITDNGTLRFHRSDAALNVSNAIGGTGALNFGVTSGGTFGAITTLSGANTFAGGVTVNSGAVRITNSSALGTGTKTVTLTNGTNGHPGVRLDGSGGAIALPATISFTTSSGDVTNPAIINEAGNNTIAGNFNLSSGGGDTRFRSDAGSLTLSGDFTLTASSRRLILAGAGNGAISGAISEVAPNALTLQKEDAGTWTLSGALTNTGAVPVNGGTLLVNGSITTASSVTVASGAKLGGTGAIAANTTINGTHTPGTGAGTQTFTGTLTYASASHLAWELTANLDTSPGQNFDRVAAAGVSIATGGTQPSLDMVLNSAGSTVIFTDTFWSQSRTWTALTATSISGAFKLGTVSTDSAGRSVSGFGAFSVQQAATTVNLVWTPAAPYQQWQAAKFGTNWNNATIAGDLVDANSNGIVNLLEYALGGEPLGSANGASALPVAGRDANGHLTLSFARFVSRSDLTLTVQGADSPGGSWTDLARSSAGGGFVVLATSASASESGSGDQRLVIIGDAFALGDPTHPRRFLRFKAEH